MSTAATYRTARTAVIGGGIVGTSIAYHLGASGEAGVALLEAGALGNGSTGRSLGGIRALFDHRLEAELSWYSWKAFQRLEEATGRSFGLRRCGYLLMATGPARGAALATAAAHAAAIGVPAEEVPLSRLAARAPGLRLDSVLRAVFSPEAGYMEDRLAPVVAYAGLAARHGVQVLEYTPVTDIRRLGDGFELRCPGHTWRTDQVIIAANAYAGPLLEALGVRLASHPYPRHAFSLTPAPAGLDPAMPLTVYEEEDLVLRHDGDHLICTCGERETSTLDLSFAPDRLPGVRRRIGRRMDLTGVAVSLAWSGLRAMTPDRRALVGPLPGVPGAWCAIGHSGHGVMHAPAIGLAMAEMVRNGRSTRFDLGQLDPARLVTGHEATPVLQPDFR